MAASSNGFSSEERRYELASVVAAWVAAFGVFLAVATVIIERIRRVRKRDTGAIAAEEDKMGYFTVDRVSAWGALLNNSTKVPLLPTITGLIQAGDLLEWTSAAVDQLEPKHGDVFWVDFYRSILDQIVCQTEPKNEQSHNREVRKYLERARKHMLKIEEKQEQEKERRAEDIKRLEEREEWLEKGPEDERYPELQRVRKKLMERRIPPTRRALYRKETPAAQASAPAPSTTYMNGTPTSGSPASHEMQDLITVEDLENQPSQALADSQSPRAELISCLLKLTKTSDSFNSGNDEPPAAPRPLRRGTSQSSITRQVGRVLTFLSLRSYTSEIAIDPEIPHLPREGLSALRETWNLDGKPCIETSREELAALALVLGMNLKLHPLANRVSGVGAFGTSLDAVQADGYWKLHLNHGTRIIKLLKSQGSGYSTLMAKHLACGSIPFADSTDWVLSVYLTNDVLRAIKHGHNIQDVQAFGGNSLEYLRRLPGAKQINAYYGIYKGTDKPFGHILKANGWPLEEFTWPRAVAGIAFGGLVPQAAPNVSEAVRFTISSDCDTGETADALERLIDRLHDLAREKQVFGPYIAYRVEANQGVDNVYYTNPTQRPPKDCAAVFGRYMNLIERIVARCERRENRSDEEVPRRVFRRVVRGIEETYKMAVEEGKRRVPYEQGRPREEGSVISLSLPHTDSCTGRASPKPERCDTDFSRMVRDITERIGSVNTIPLEDCATVVRAVLAVWAQQVPEIELEESSEDLLAGSANGRPALGNPSNESAASGNLSNRRAALDDLPTICALG